MAPPKKSLLYNQLKLAVEMGHKEIKLNKPYVSYTEDELEGLLRQHGLMDGPQTSAPLPEPEPVIPATPAPNGAESRAPGDPFAPGVTPAQRAERLGVPLADRGADRAGLTFNTHGINDPVRVDLQGRVWFQDEVQKPAIPKARARRILKSQTTNTKVIEQRGDDGRLIESFEVAGDEVRDLEIKVTLPSWQVGIYWDPRLPFRVHVYEDVRGFDFRDIVKYYGGLDLIPSSIKRIYVGGDLCFDIQSTRNTMEQQLRDAQLGRGI